MARYKDQRMTVASIPSINAEFEKIAETQADHLSRKGDTPNQMETDIDMNSRRIINLPEPESDHEPMPFGKAREVIDAAASASQNAETATQQADRAEQEADRAEESADRVDLGALDQAVVDAEQALLDAEQQAANAAESAVTANQQADRAESEADRAETAAEVAAAAGRVYETSAAGQADSELVDGDYFWVVSAEDSEVLELWRKGASSATDTGKRTASNLLIDTVTGDRFIFRFSLQEGELVLNYEEI